MKLNPPETAPRDGTVILAWFGKYKTPAPVVWSDEVYAWDIYLKPYDYSLYGELFDDAMRGWLPLPEIDDEGNVT